MAITETSTVSLACLHSLKPELAVVSPTHRFCMLMSFVGVYFFSGLEILTDVITLL